MLGNVLDKVLHEDEELIYEESKNREAVQKEKSGIDTKVIVFSIVIFLIALAPRLYLLFANDIQSPGWYDDTFHHWQIAYLTKTVGLGQGFLRLWDFKGMEFFWGLLHPLVLIILFAISGSVNIILTRLLSIFCGSLAIAFLFILVRRYFNFTAALGAAIFATFMPVVLYSDTVGMQEPLALILILGALLLYPKKPIFVGVLLALAGMVRADYWIFEAGLFFVILLTKQKFERKALFAIGWIVPTLLYAKYLLNYTGNAIYPIYWNYLASVKGEWFADVPLPPGALQTQFISRIIFVVGLLGAILMLVKRPRYYLLFLFGLGNLFVLGFMLGFGAYIRGYVPRFWIDRLFSWPYTFTGVVISSVFLYYLPIKAHVRYIVSLVGWMVLIAVLLLSQLSWIPINKYAREARSRYLSERNLAASVASYYKEGTILIPEDRPPFVYFLVKDHGIVGAKLLGQMFDPFFYFKEDPFSDWQKYRETLISWLKNYNVRLLVVYKDRGRYQNFIKNEPEMFRVLNNPAESIQIYEVRPE